MVLVLETINENDKKKAYLREYRASVRRVTRIEEELKEIRTMKTSISIMYDDMPRGTGQSDLSSYAAELDKLERELVAERYRRVMLYKDISSRIKCLKSKNENDVLFYRYIKGLDWWDIAEQMGNSERQIYRFHGKGLGHFELPKNKDVSKCQ